MLEPKLPEPELLKAVLEPLLEDFLYGFERSQQFLESTRVSFLTEIEQTHLLERVKKAQEEVKTARTLFQVTGGQVGIEMTLLIAWHRLLTHYWQIAFRFRQEQSTSCVSQETQLDPPENIP